VDLLFPAPLELLIASYLMIHDYVPVWQSKRLLEIIYNSLNIIVIISAIAVLRVGFNSARFLRTVD
jgi:hypothetical protein